MSLINFKKLHHVQICIPLGFEDDARAFYTGILGMEEISKPKNIEGVWYRAGDSELHLGIEPEIYPTKRFPAFEVEGLDEIRKRLTDKGLTVKEELPIPGYRRISILDPWKNKLELMERI